MNRFPSIFLLVGIPAVIGSWLGILFLTGTVNTYACCTVFALGGILTLIGVLTYPLETK